MKKLRFRLELPTIDTILLWIQILNVSTMAGIIQFIQSSPEELEDRIYIRLKSEIDIIKSDFQPKLPTEYLTRNQVKEMLDVDLSTIHNWTKRGKLQAYGIGNRIYYKRSEVEQAIVPLHPSL